MWATSLHLEVKRLLSHRMYTGQLIYLSGVGTWCWQKHYIILTLSLFHYRGLVDPSPLTAAPLPTTSRLVVIEGSVHPQAL